MQRNKIRRSTHNFSAVWSAVFGRGRSESLDIKYQSKISLGNIKKYCLVVGDIVASCHRKDLLQNVSENMIYGFNYEVKLFLFLGKL